MKILAVIPARGNSRRLPGKNFRTLGGKPLICWSIDVAKDISAICDILVSTDNPEIAEACKGAGAYVPWLRPTELATDTASSVDVALHALDWYEAENGPVDGLLLLQPTSPFRTKQTLQKGIDLFEVNSALPVLGVSPAHAHPMWTLKSDGDKLVPYFEDHGFGKRSQDLPEALVANGCFYLISPQMLRNNKSFVGNAVQPLLIGSIEESIDIDTEEDWCLAETLLKNHLNNELTNFDPTMSAATREYIQENREAFSLKKIVTEHYGKPLSNETATLTGIVHNIIKDLVKGPLSYLKQLYYGYKHISLLNTIKGSKKNKFAIVIGNGPSQDFITQDTLQKFQNLDNDVFAINFWHKNKRFDKIIPNYLVFSDAATLSSNAVSSQRNDLITKENENLKKYLLLNSEIKIMSPIARVKQLSDILGGRQIYGFIDNQMSSVSSNIDPRFPRGYCSLTLYKALALAIFMGYKKIYLIGMDNTYPRDIFCDSNNRVYNLDRHAGSPNALLDMTKISPTMDVNLLFLFRIFYDLRRCFGGSQVLNLDCFSLTDVFPKISKLSDIDNTLLEGNINA